jgi:hypothetical protein
LFGKLVCYHRVEFLVLVVCLFADIVNLKVSLI